MFRAKMLEKGTRAPYHNPTAESRFEYRSLPLVDCAKP